MTQPEQSNSLPRCADCGAALARWDEPHTIDDCQAYEAWAKRLAKLGAGGR